MIHILFKIMREFIKDKGLIPMVDFVLEAYERCQSTLDFEAYIFQYAEFLKLVITKHVLENNFDCFEFEKIGYFIHVYSKHQAAYNRENKKELFRISPRFDDVVESSFLTYRKVYKQYSTPILKVEDLLRFGYKVTFSEKGLDLIFGSFNDD
jgi:hypothetical protein